MDHDDIIVLAQEGKVAEAEALLAQRRSHSEVSGEDQQTIEAAIEQAKEAKKAEGPSRRNN